MDAAKKRKLPRVDLEVSEISYGSAPIGNRFGAIVEVEAQALIEEAW